MCAARDSTWESWALAKKQRTDEHGGRRGSGLRGTGTCLSLGTPSSLATSTGCLLSPHYPPERKGNWDVRFKNTTVLPSIPKEEEKSKEVTGKKVIRLCWPLGFFQQLSVMGLVRALESAVDSLCPEHKGLCKEEPREAALWNSHTSDVRPHCPRHRLRTHQTPRDAEPTAGG